MADWTSKDIRNDLKLLERMLKTEKNPIIREEIYRAIGETKRIILEEEMKPSDEVSPDAIFALYDESARYEIYYPIIKEFIRKTRYTVDNFSFQSPIVPWNLNLSEQDMIELIQEFFNSTPKEIKEIYDEINKRKKRIRFEKSEEYESQGRMVFVPKLNKPYITVGHAVNKPSILQSFAHEEGHSIGSILNPERYTDDKHSLFQEIESTFFELLGIDFFSQELNHEEMKKRLFYKMQSIFFNAEEILLERKLSEIGFSQNHPNEDNFSLEDNDMIFTLQDIANGGCSFEKNIIYLISYIIAIELFELYKENKEQAIERLKKIVQREKGESEYQNIIQTVTPNKSLIKHKKRITQI